jgi:hypothetical protein
MAVSELLIVTKKDWIEHYKGVRYRLQNKPKPVLLAKPEGSKFPKIFTPRELIIKNILKPIFKNYDTNLDELRGDKRFDRLSNARQAVSIALSQYGWTTMKIGEFLNRDHSTILHHLRRNRKKENDA